ncbi:hypothetical protein JM946_01265 [Steroidobacter sp. S1-65]|uniref:TonB C-terminal domain-containing protein n=1 Tax=Steroidobacter gossypii TaxID=2805490 RepID=A0ABS1WQV1_9GAMM|nr:hypothetical protein [Steroidobacter gossypii]MBM0103348.1 hypothetical protein [Steroidobacter gossypii]
MNSSPYHIRRRLGIAGLFAGAIVLAGCGSAPTVAPKGPELQLLESKPLSVAETCEVTGSYFVEFTVLSDGTTGNIQAPPGPPCMQQALTAWVETFRYAPPGRQTPAGVEWLMVTGRKGS